MQNAHQQHFSLFNWEPHATAHKSSSTRTNSVVCEPGRTAHKSSSRRTVAVVCEPGQTAHKPSACRQGRLGTPCICAPHVSARLPVISAKRFGVSEKGPHRHRIRNTVPANMEQTKKGHVSYLCYLNSILAAAPHVAPPWYAHTP